MIPTQKIKIISFILAIIGIITEICIASIQFTESNEYLFSTLNLFRSFHLEFFNGQLFMMRFFHSFNNLNIIDLIFYLLLFGGAVLYSTSKGMETRLVRFVMSVIFIANSFHILLLVYLIINSIFYIFDEPIHLIFIMGDIIKSILLIYLSYSVLKDINATKTLAVEHKNVEQYHYEEIKTASTWQRLLHLLLDSFLSIVIFSPILMTLGNRILDPLANIGGEQITLYAFVAISRILYYLFSEGILNASPAKYISETRVTDPQGNKPAFANILGRTFARFIPFEPFSFFGTQGWHDSLTKTQVVREIRTGMPGKNYLFIFLAIPVLLLILSITLSKINRFQEDIEINQTYKRQVSILEESIHNLDTSDLIKIMPEGSYDQFTFLKVEQIQGDDITVSIVTVDDGEYSSHVYISEKYALLKDSLSKTTIHKKDLYKAFDKEYKKYKDEKAAIDFFGDGIKYELVSIDRMYAPNIYATGSGSWGNDEISIEFVNMGEAAKIISIKSVKGDIVWLDVLPMEIATAEDENEGSFDLHGGNYSDGDQYIFQMELEDFEGDKYVFEVEGSNMNNTVKRIK